MFEPESKSSVPYDFFYNMFPVYAVITAVIMLIILLISGAKLLQLFWNSFVSDIFTIREIYYQEAVALVIFIRILIR